MGNVIREGSSRKSVYIISIVGKEASIPNIFVVAPMCGFVSVLFCVVLVLFFS